jgi:osomolarity two-component system phosphorelay intermediate protein YPD1
MVQQSSNTRQRGTKHWTNGGFVSTNRGDNDLSTLSSLGHFLKGSAATLGFNKIRDSCQVIQQYGHKLNVDGTSEPDEKVCLKKISEALKTAEVDTTELEKIMNGFFKKEE